jgi:hypothetical protein
MIHGDTRVKLLLLGPLLKTYKNIEVNRNSLATSYYGISRKIDARWFFNSLKKLLERL